MPVTKDKKMDLVIQTVRAVSELRNHIRRYIQTRIKELQTNLTFEMFEVMFYLWQKDGMNQQELSRLTFRDKSSTTYLIDNLSRRGLVIRLEDPEDRRSKRIALTPAGSSLGEQLRPLMMELYAILGGDIETLRFCNGIALIKDMTKNILTTC